MVFHSKQLHGSRRIIAPRFGARGQGFVSADGQGGWREWDPASARLPRDDRPEFSFNGEGDDSESSSGEVPWLVTVEQRLLHERGSRRFRTRYRRSNRGSRRYHPYDFEAILDGILLSDSE